MAADETLRPTPTVPREPSGAAAQAASPPSGPRGAAPSRPQQAFERASNAPTQAADRHSARATFFPGLTRLDLWHEEEG